MKIFYDEKTGCILLESLHAIPGSAIEITQETHDSILNRASDERVCVVNGQIVIKKIEISEIEKLALAKQSKEIEINNARDAALLVGFEFDGRLYDSDTESLQNINGLVTQTLVQPAFTTTYITKNNEIVRLNSEEIKALGEAARAYKEHSIFKARMLKDKIIAAETIDELNSIAWDE